MFKTLQVLRLKQEAHNINGDIVNVGTRVVVVNVKKGVVKARYGTSEDDYQYLTAPVTAFTTATKGRPVGTGKKNKDTGGGMVVANSEAQ